MRAVNVDAFRPCSAVQIQYVSIAFACASFTSPRQASRKRSAAVSPSSTFSCGTGGLSAPRADCATIESAAAERRRRSSFAWSSSMSISCPSCHLPLRPASAAWRSDM